MSLYDDGRNVAEIISTKPRMNPPATAPLTLPMPPITAETKAFQPTSIPMYGSITGYASPTNIPATAASPVPIAKAKETMASILMPSSGATAGSHDRARMAMPVRVLATRISRLAMSAREVVMIRS